MQSIQLDPDFSPWITEVTPDNPQNPIYDCTSYERQVDAGNTIEIHVGGAHQGAWVWDVWPSLNGFEGGACTLIPSDGIVTFGLYNIQRGTEPGPHIILVQSSELPKARDGSYNPPSVARALDGYSKLVVGIGNHENRHDRHVIYFERVAPQPEGEVEIKSVLLEPTTLTPNGQYGVLLRVTMTIFNGTSQPLETQGPEPGFRYIEGDTFQSIGKPEVKGTFRVGLDFEGRTGIDHPYRWGLGSALAPGATVTVEGFVELHNVGVTKYWAGLVQEQERWIQDHIGEITVTVTESPRYTLTLNTSGQGSVTVSPEQADYAPGATVTLTATPADDWRFSSWGGTISDNPLNVTMSKDLTLTAVFTEIETPPSDDVAAHLAAHDQELLEQAAQMEQIRQKQAEIDAVFADMQSKLSTQGVAINDIAGWRQRIKDA